MEHKNATKQNKKILLTESSLLCKCRTHIIVTEDDYSLYASKIAKEWAEWDANDRRIWRHAQCMGLDN